MTIESKTAGPDGQEPIINIVGEKVALGPDRSDLVPLYHRWSNDFEVVHLMGTPYPSTLESEEALHTRVSKDQEIASFTIYTKAQLRPIGSAGLVDINHSNRTAEFYIMIGDKTSWGKGYGTEVARLMIEYGFTCLGLHNVFLRVNTANERGIRAYRRAGFRVAGRLRKSVRLGGRACDYDSILMDCLATEFQGAALRHLRPKASEANE